MINLLAVGGPGTTPYKIVLILHLLAVITAFGTPFAYSAISRVAAQRQGEAGGAIADVSPTLHKTIALPALVIAMVFGMGLTGVSNKVYSFSDAWISASFAVAILLIAWSLWVLLPALNKFAAGVRQSADAANAVKGKVAMATGVYHLGLVVLVFLMVWKPGA